ncbi:hypothetical protein AYL99_01238 [Fonsecaea erecta]|uniref:peptidylprolyl isomerase n=1 Tax=Fonsecaea erecta TaxID=1367422 RepID=A0A179A0Y4_9EURO|nr:hypothetical protein AYL99_01238 [Fonsecaea erecta]OAP65266.1 hypothetical protein AYL99_01238 [Fonsecaea erecta]
MAVYTGRAAFAVPGHNFTVFQPLTGTEENVDVTILTQQLKPILRALRELKHLATQAGIASREAQSARPYTGPAVQQMHSLRRALTGLNLHDRALSDFLIFSAEDPSFQSKRFVWSYGDDQPCCPPSSTEETTELDDFCVIPDEYLCPISPSLFEEPVHSSDGFVYDRQAIVRWWQLCRSSPMTGLPIVDTHLRPDEVLRDQINAWVAGEDVINSLPSTFEHARLSGHQPRHIIDFVGPSVCFSRQLPGRSLLLNLHKVAFRWMRGLYHRFSLHVGGVYLPCSEEAISDRGVVSGQTITISPDYGTDGDTSGGSTSQRPMCPIRVYNTPDLSKESFKYWVPLKSELAYGSIIFHNWRYHVQHGSLDHYKHDTSPWVNLINHGDGSINGSFRNLWASLSQELRTLRRMEVQKYEAAYKHTRDDGTGPEARQCCNCRILKVHLMTYAQTEERKLKETELQQGKVRSKMAVANGIFSQFINGLIAYSYPTNFGLVTFETEAGISQK